MTEDFAAALRRSLEQTRAGNPAEATRLIQEALGGGGTAGAPTAASASGPEPRPARNVPSWLRPGTRVDDAELAGEAPTRPFGLDGLNFPSGPASGAVPDLDCPAGARFEKRRHDGPHGARDYLIYVPGRAGPVRGVLVMLHGCTQSAVDFARGTQMNDAAERAGFVVLYPEQTRSHNAQACWNWFRPGDQGAAGGEPAILAAMAQDVAAEFGVARGSVFAAGLSAGGAMAAILGQTHPGLFGAVGVHSGLAPGSACDVISAFAAMRGEAGGGTDPLLLPAIVFQGESDATVAPVNAERLGGILTDATTLRERRDGRSVRRTAGQNAAGHPVEMWQIEGLGHAWSGGSAGGSYTDPAGPDASAEMMRFFVARIGA